MLTYDEFAVLNYLRTHSGAVQRELSAALGVSLGKINTLLTRLTANGLIAEKQVSQAGMAALEPYKVDNAIIMAAGMSTRFAPLSYEKPKGLLIVKGEVLIEREIRQLMEAGITDITIVVGYMKEKFFYLEEKFGVKIVVNEDYYKFNNTSSLIRVCDSLKNTYICSSDNYFVENVFEPYVYQAYYSAVYTQGETDEYCLTTDKTGLIKKVVIGGCDSWYMLGHVYFDQAFSTLFRSILTEEYTKKETREQLWENLYMRYIDRLHLFIRKYDADKVLEFDSLDDLRLFDEEYINNVDSTILTNISQLLNCEKKDIRGIKAINSGLTNRSFRFCVGDKQYVYRYPGSGTEKFINRDGEAKTMQIVSKLGLDDTFIYMDPKIGWKVSRFIPNARELDYHNPEDVASAIGMIRRLHDANISVDYEFNVWNKVEEFIQRLREEQRFDFDNAQKHYEMLRQVKEYVLADGYSRACLCHNDCYSPNFLVDEQGKMYLIDWEYSGTDDPASDLGTFICCSDYSFEEAAQLIRQYLGHEPSEGELNHYFGYVAIAAYYWYVWALYQEVKGNPMGEWLYLWHNYSLQYAKKALSYFQP